MIAMLNFLKKKADETYTENGAKTYITSGSECLDLFFKAGAMRNTSEKTISDAVIRAYSEDPDKTMKIIFFARDVRGGLGERRFFRTAIKALAYHAPDSVSANAKYFAEYGRYDDLCTLIGTPCESAASNEIRTRLSADISAMKSGKPASLLSKWLPSVNASSEETKEMGRRICGILGMSERNYRKTLSALRKYTDIIENRLRVMDYTFDYSKQTSGAMFKYRKAFIRNDGERYKEFISAVNKGKAKLNAGTLYPYDIVRACLTSSPEKPEREALDAAWRSLADHGNGDENANAIAVVDGSGSMTWTPNGKVRPIDVAISLGIYLAEHNKGAFAGHFITFSRRPRLIGIKGNDIFGKVRYCSTFDECANTNLEATFDLILNTAVENHLSRSDIPSRMYIISDMEFDSCAEGGNSLPMFMAMKQKYAKHGYDLPEVVFWNVNSRSENIPVRMTDTGAALVSGASPAVFDMVRSGEISPEKIMNDIISNERYARICA